MITSGPSGHLPSSAQAQGDRRAGGFFVGARLLQLALLLVITWLAAVEFGLAARTAVEAGLGSKGALPASDAPAMQIAPLGVTIEPEAWRAGEAPAALARLARAGIGWVRVRLDWSLLEPQPGRFDWAESDRVLNEIEAAGLTPVVVLDGSPAWARAAADAENSLAPPADPANLAAFAAAVATRYASRLRFYQVWDEPNISPHWGSRHIDPVAYAHMLRMAAEALRSRDDDAVVLTAALAPTTDRGHLAIDEVYFLQRMLAAGAAGSFDAVAAQPIGFGHAPTHARRAVEVLNFQRVTLLRRALVSAGLPEVPIWAVRVGWNVRADSPWRTVSAADREQYAAEARAVAAQWPWLATLGWAVDQPAAPQSDPVWGFALTEPLLAAWTGPVTVLSSAPAHDPTQSVALWMALLLAALGWSVRAVWRLPVRLWLRRLRSYDALPLAALWASVALLYFFSTWPPLIGACWLAATLLATARPAVAVAIAAALIPFHFQHKDVNLGVVTFALPPAVALAFALVPALLVHCARHGAPTWRRRTPATFVDLAVLLWITLNVAALGNVWHLGDWATAFLHMVLAPALLYATVRSFITTPAQARSMLAALAAGGVLVAGVGLVLWLSGQGVAIDGVLRLVGPHFSPNHTALYLLRTLFVTLGLALAVQGLLRRLWLAAAVLVFAALLLTASRGALVLGLPAGLLFCFWLWTLRGDLPLGARVRRVMARPLVRATLVLLPIVLVAALITGETRLLNRESVDSRILLWHAALSVWRAQPLAGVGPGGFFWSYPAWLVPGAMPEPNLQHPHNVWLEMLVQGGLPALGWLLAIVLLWFAMAGRRLARIRSNLQWPVIGLCGALAAALAHAQVDAFLALADLAMWFFTALALFANLLNHKRSSGSPVSAQ